MVKYAILDRNNGTVLRVLETSEAIANPPPNFILLDNNVGNEIVGKVYTEVGLEINTSTPMLFTTSTINETTADPEDTYTAWISTYEIGRCLAYDDDKLEYSLRGMEADISSLQTDKADIDHVHSGYATSNHTHTEYASASHSHTDYATQTSVDTLSDEIDGKANAVHNHTEYALTSHNHDTIYAPISHSHNNYVTTTDFDALETEVDGKASSTHTHTASEIGAAISGHNHDADYADINHNHDSAYASASHDHNEDYSSIDHTHANYATTASLSELSTIVSGKANTSHTHDDRYYTETEVDTKLATKADSSHTHTGVYDVSGAAASALSSANTYTDEAIDTLGETVATKANTSALTSHTGNTTVHITSTERTNWNSAKAHADSAHAPTNAEPNQNAFSNVVVGDVTISADTKTDTITLVAGNNVTITPDSTGDSITISSANTVYTHPTSAGNKHIPAGGSSGQILRWSDDGTVVWGNDNNTTYSNATQTSSGLMSNTDKTKLDGIAEGANNYTLPSAGTSLGGVKSGGDVQISGGVITVNDDSHNHVISNIDGLQGILDEFETITSQEIQNFFS